jgi:hypothetical protein
MKLSQSMLLRHMGNVGIAILICFEGRNAFYSMDRGLGNHRNKSGRFGKEKILPGVNLTLLSVVQSEA